MQGSILPMRLLICATEYYPYGSGIANVAYNVVEHLKEQGVECIVCSPTGPDIKLGNPKLIEKTGILGMLHYWRQVSHHLKRNNYDAVWLHNPFIISGGVIKNCLITMHSTYYGESFHQVGATPLLRMYRRFVSRLERYCLIHMDKNTIVAGVGRPTCKELEAIGLERERITYIPNGVDIRQFRPSHHKGSLRKKFGLPEDDIILLSVGRLTHHKRPHLMIEIISNLEREVGDVTLCIAGTGELLDEMKDLVEKGGLRKVLFLGHVNHDEDLPELYACSDYYIMTSKYEGLPLTLLEAMASGLPCIVSDIPNLEIVRDADCGIVVNFDNMAEAQKQITSYLSEEHMNHEENARSYAEKTLDWSIIAERYLDVFKKMMR